VSASFLPHTGITLKLDELKNLTSQFQERVDNITRQANDSLTVLRESPGGEQKDASWTMYLLLGKASHRNMREYCLMAHGKWS